MGSTAAGKTFQAYTQVIRTASLHAANVIKQDSNNIDGAEGLGADKSGHHHSRQQHQPGSPRRSTNITFQDDDRILHTRRLTVVDPNPAILAAATASRKTTKDSLFQRIASVIPPPIPSSESTSSRESRLQSKESLYTESVGRVKWDEFPLKRDNGDFELETEDDQGEKKTMWQKTIELIKIMAPHVGLNIVLLSYIGIGAMIFIWLEAETELSIRRNKLKQILNIYQLIINESVSMCGSNNINNNINDIERINVTSAERRLRPLLSVLSRTHEYDDRFTRNLQMWTDNEDQLITKWTFASAVLYALTVITSTGFDHLTPTTNAGRIFTVFFGLLGIPLMFITAADIGKFLSEIVITFYGKMLDIIAWIASVFDAMKDYLMGADDESIDSSISATMALMPLELRRKRKKRKVTDDESDLEDEDERLQLPIVSYFALVIGYCAIGSCLFNWWEKGAVWSFVHGVFFSFNTITTISLGNICVRSKVYLGFIVFYVIIGLAVITASLDLCSATLKKTFTKLHYFGRKIRGARKGFANMGDDIREAMKLIAALKKTRPSKERITLEDLKRFLEVQEHLLRQPFVPYNVHIFKWIEDAYAQYIDENGSISGEKMQKALQSLPNHHENFKEPFLVF